ncbi:MAG: rhamnulokinase [Victivallales bacterium]|nr:rhamnulokinase [Victivallales bacterium]
MKKNFLAIDLGASSGRAILGSLDKGKIVLKELHRFPNGPVAINGGLFWDILSLFTEIKAGIAKAAALGEKISGIGIDTWGVDFAFLDKDGFLAGNPRNYRDPRNDAAMPFFYKKVSPEQLYQSTGIQILGLNTVFQLAAAVQNGDQTLKIADKLLFMPNALTYLLCGDKSAEYSIATTSALYNPTTGDWAWNLIKAMGLKKSLFPKIVPSGTVVGKLLPQLQEELKAPALPVVLVGSHDTASAVAAVPAKAGSNWAYLSSGTWSLIGLELDKPLLSAAAQKANYTNEGGVGNTIRFLKNILGLWLVQECRNEWKRQGESLDFGEMVKLAEKAEPFRSFVDPNDSSFVTPGDMPARIQAFCKRTKQPVPETKGQIIRTALESLAMRYRQSVDELETITGRKIDVLHIVGGGCQNRLLVQFTANAINRPVLTGPIEGTALGNIAVQAIATGAIRDLAKAREIVAASTELESYTPKNTKAWNTAYRKYAKVIS